MKKVAMFWSLMPTERRCVRIPSLAQAAAWILALCVVLLMLGGCFFFRSKPDPKIQEMTGRLSPGLTSDEVLELIGPPQRRGQNLFDKKKEYWIYEFVKQQKKKKSRSGTAERDGRETVVESELQLLFERGRLVNWSVAPINE
jgi:hypothetical protein